MRVGNVFEDSAPPAKGERFDALAEFRGVRIERIVGSAGPEPTKYLQSHDEWVVLLRGHATLEVFGESHDLAPGDHVRLPAGTPHTVVRTSNDALWLAVHVEPKPG